MAARVPLELDEPSENVVWNGGPEVRERLEDSGDIGQVFLSLAGPAAGILSGPDLAFQHVLQSCDDHDAAQDSARRRSVDEPRIARTSLQLNTEVRARLRYVHAVRKSFRRERLAETLVQLFGVGGGHDEVQIEADDRLDVLRVDRLAADDAVAKPLRI